MKYLNEEEFTRKNVFGRGQENTAYAKFFVGNSYLNPLTVPGQCPVFLANVTFEPGCRNNWHIHHAKEGGGQLLICTAGEGWYQEEGKVAVSLTPGMVITIPPEVKHWHGAKRDSWFAHIALEVPGTETSNEWLESVSERSKMVSGICLRYFRPKLVVPKYASKLATGSTTQSESSGLLVK